MPTMTPSEVLSRYWELGRLPIDPRHIARQAGIQIESISPFDDDMHGVIGSYTPGTGGFPAKICVNETEAPNRVRFTLAHELGHHFLEHAGTSFRDTTKQFNIRNFDPSEVAANNFAAQLLIPATYLKVLVESKRITDLRELAESFGVSELAMDIRLQKLKYIK
jgi:hypothetical protein